MKWSRVAKPEETFISTKECAACLLGVHYTRVLSMKPDLCNLLLFTCNEFSLWQSYHGNATMAMLPWQCYHGNPTESTLSITLFKTDNSYDLNQVFKTVF